MLTHRCVHSRQTPPPVTGIVPFLLTTPCSLSQAIDLDPTNAQLFSNRSLCWMRLGQAQHAVADAQTARELRPDWSKACYREGSALQLLQVFKCFFEILYDYISCLNSILLMIVCGAGLFLPD